MGVEKFSGHEINKESSSQEQKVEDKKAEFISSEEFENQFSKPEHFEKFPVDNELFETAKELLTGKVGEITQREKEFYLRFMKALLERSSESEASPELLAILEQVDEEASEVFNEYLHSEASIISEQQEKLGISNTEQEQAYVVQVLKPEGWDEAKAHEKRGLWKELTGTPSLFIDVSKSLGAPTIFLSPDDADLIRVDSETAIQKKIEDSLQFVQPGSVIHASLLKDFEKQKEKMKQAYEGMAKTPKELLAHEYRHSQRSFLSENNRYFRFIDEAYTNVGGNYGYLRAALITMYLSSQNLTSEGAMSVYESGSDEEKEKFMSDLKEAFGPKAFLLLAAKKSSQHNIEGEGLDNLPYKQNSEQAETYEDTSFFETMLQYISEHNPDWKEQMKRRLETHKVKEGQTVRGLLEVLMAHHLRRYTGFKEEIGAEKIQELEEVFEEEITRRKALGEKGFYDNE